MGGAWTAGLLALLAGGGAGGESPGAGSAPSRPASPLQSARPLPPTDLGPPSKYIPFPALVLEKQEVRRLTGRLRITFKGTWHNLTPQDVAYRFVTHVMPRQGNTAALFSVTDMGPSGGLRLRRGEQAPFFLTVESSASV